MRRRRPRATVAVVDPLDGVVARPAATSLTGYEKVDMGHRPKGRVLFAP